ncbi:holo-ACP synthase [Alkalibacterium olivapovliticus]|uniref:Holo-[acyl-carrier-protein] synthase n=1 Tax=Alkalibacterium olivapovliticus TaxID=99907 RepID=A0A2T0W5W7_9LACT|nr:holo-ACP synthase [Alkalibacterium olivapovliticus]PRY80944.1 holo-[acyl-carrier protein] synthase [Alkalibacterium olivapovliticus]
MIVGIGLDVVDIERINKAYIRRPSFAGRVLTHKELELFNALSGTRQIEFLAGRFSAKEAYSKALGTGIGKLTFLDVEILPDNLGKPVLSSKAHPCKAWVSISHTETVAVAQVILEEK